MTAILIQFDSLEWREAPMPGAAPIRMALLPRLPDGGFRAFVRFPAGWSRPELGHYAVPEEFLIAEGELHLNGKVWKAGGYAWVPAFRARRDLGSPTGCVAFAWFGATPRWIPGEPPAAASSEVRFEHWRDAPAGVLYDGPEHRTWIEDGRLLRRAEALDLESFAWTHG